MTFCQGWREKGASPYLVVQDGKIRERVCQGGVAGPIQGLPLLQLHQMEGLLLTQACNMVQRSDIPPATVRQPTRLTGSHDSLSGMFMRLMGHCL